MNFFLSIFFFYFFFYFLKKSEDLVNALLFKSLEMTKLHVKQHFVEAESDEVLIEKCACMDIQYDLEGNSS